jgi:hypothetical protein
MKKCLNLEADIKELNFYNYEKIYPDEWKKRNYFSRVLCHLIFKCRRPVFKREKFIKKREKIKIKELTEEAKRFPR